MRRLIPMAVAFAVALPSMASAGDYVVVRSAVVDIAPGREFDAGSKIAAPAGRTLTVLHASGDVQVLTASAAGIQFPQKRATNPDAGRLARLSFLLVPPPERRTFAAERALTPEAQNPSCKTEALDSLDSIAAAADRGCVDTAAAALERFIQHQATAHTAH